jgi:DNA-binding transcriptional ArsR family regulator
MDTFFALADPTRRNILEMLASKGQLSASDISDKFDVSAPAISQHLKVLRESHLVKMEKKAQQRIYQLNLDAIDEFDAWVKRMKELWEERFDALESLIEQEKKKLIKK